MNLIVAQFCKPNGVWTVYSNGLEVLLPYEIDENGNRYVELFPNEKVVQLKIRKS